MTDRGDISFRLRVRRDRDPSAQRRWLVIPIAVGGTQTLSMLPNSVATRSVITPAAARSLRREGLLGADIVDLSTGRTTGVLKRLHLADNLIPDLEVQVREIPALRGSDGEYVVDGYLGLDFFFGPFSLITIDTRTLRITLRPDW